MFYALTLPSSVRYYEFGLSVVQYSPNVVFKE